MRHRYFNHLYSEICVAVNRRISRYDLWLLMSENGDDPNTLTRSQARRFVENDLTKLLRDEGVALDLRAQGRLEKRILRFDPDHPTPEEWMIAFSRRAQEAA